MFAGASWVDIKLLRRRGFLTRKAARMTFYLRTRLLYDLDYEKDPMCNIQTLILLSLWWEGPPQYKDGWHWLGIALSLARAIGLHQDINNQYLKPKARALRRRLWWSCTIRDTCASMATNRVPRIRDSDFRVAPLTLDDFEINVHPRPDHHNMRAKSLYFQRQQASICIQTASICRIITRVLLKAYHETSTGNIDILYFHPIPKQRKTHIEPRELRDIEDDFRQWLENAPSEVLHPGPMPSRSDTHERALFVHRALLSILYHTGFVLIHRQRTLPSNGHVPDEPNKSPLAEGTPRAIVREAALQVNKIIMDAYAADVMKEMPPTVISCLFPISVSHITDMKSEDPMVRYEGRQRLEECRQALRELVDGHLSAEWAVNFLSYVESRLNPVQHPTTKRGPAVVHGKTLSTVPEKMSLAGYDQCQGWEQNRGQNTEGDAPIQPSGSEGPKSTNLASPNLDEQPTAEHNPFLYTHTPAGFSDLVFPDTWLGGPDAQNSTSGGTWVDNDIISLPFA
ncbi:Fungal specific transcription factor domain-containing protein [Cladophialophora immunda]|nr:Fungal specific transcription factor domain-containing protein [Cladophialophora immunda]